MKTRKVTTELTIPVGYRVAAGEQPRQANQDEMYAHSNGVLTWRDCDYSLNKYVILEPDPMYIDTTTEEYRVEVYRQWLRGKVIECLVTVKKDFWADCCSNPHWEWGCTVYRVKPVSRDENGPYYLDNGEKVYVPG